MDKPVFISVDPQAIMQSMIADYEAMTGRTLQPAQVERLMINAFVYRESLLRTELNEAALQMLVEFARAPFLDFLGQLVGVRRLTASAAVCKIKLVFVEGHGALTVPAGVRIQTIDGNAVFALDVDTPIGADVDEIEVAATALSVGKSANGYDVNTVTVILDPQPYLISANNVEKTAGGADDETDDELRERIMLAPQSFSNAGPVGAYKFFAKGANPGIIDVSVTSPVPGQVNIYPLMEGGTLPNSEVLAQVFDACNPEKRRPLTDTVVVAAPTVVLFEIDVSLVLLSGAVASEVQAAVYKALLAYGNSRKQQCGLDVVREQIIKLAMIENVYSVQVNEPSASLVVAENEVSIISGLMVTVSGFSDE